MIDHIRNLITVTYGFLDSNADFLLIKHAISNFKNIPDDFTKLGPELRELKMSLRMNLHEITRITDQIDGVIKEMKIIINREKIKDKTLERRMDRKLAGENCEN